MRKLTLDLESLAVQSFETTPAEAGGRGTVLGRDRAINVPGVLTRDTYPGCPSPLCVDTPLASCDGSCVDSCYESCNGTCRSCPASCVASCNGTCPSEGPSCGPSLCPPPPTDPIAVNPYF